MCVADLLCGVGDQKVELLVPEGRFVAALAAGGILPAAAHDLGAQAQAAVGVALPGEPPHPQVARLYQVHLCQQCNGPEEELQASASKANKTDEESPVMPSRAVITCVTDPTHMPSRSLSPPPSDLPSSRNVQRPQHDIQHHGSCCD